MARGTSAAACALYMGSHSAPSRTPDESTSGAPSMPGSNRMSSRYTVEGVCEVRVRCLRE